jgi:hypothetical protein
MLSRAVIPSDYLCAFRIANVAIETPIVDASTTIAASVHRESRVRDAQPRSDPPWGQAFARLPISPNLTEIIDRVCIKIMKMRERAPLNTAHAYLFAECDIFAPGSVNLRFGSESELEFGLLARTYQEAARALVHALECDTGFQRAGCATEMARVFPVIHLYRHALELALKGVILAGGGGLLTGHVLTALLPAFDRIIKSLGWDYDGLGVEGWRTEQAFRARLQEFESFDPQGMNVRYPVDRHGAPSLGSCWLNVNVFSFAAKMEDILQVLGHLPSVVSEMMDANEQMRYEA